MSSCELAAVRSYALRTCYTQATPCETTILMNLKRPATTCASLSASTKASALHRKAQTYLHRKMLLLRPTGRFPVGVQDLKYCTAESSSSIAADNHVVGRLYYPCKPSGWLQRPLTWIRAYQYAQGYVSWGFRNPSTTKEQLLKATAQNTIYSLGLTKWIPASYNATPENRFGRLPVIVFSHGAASMRNTYSILCTEFASRGFVVAAVEHADGTACCAELATGEFMLLKGLGTGAALEAKCEYRVQECVTMAQILQALSAGTDIPGLQLSSWSSNSSSSSSIGDGSGGSSPFKSLLDLNRLAIMGHSCGGATAAAAAAQHAEFKCGVAFDPWWPLLPKDSAALRGWKTNSPLLVLGSQDWNTPGKMWCDGDRQDAVFKACLPKAAAAAASRPSARTPVVASATISSSSSGSSDGPGGGAIHIVPSGSSHGSFTDLPFLLPAWATAALRKLAGAKSAPAQVVPPMIIQDVITWSSHRFLTDHLALSDEATASITQYNTWRQQQQQKSSSDSSSSSQSTGAAAAAAVAQAPAGVTADRAESLVDHLAADENLIMADESAIRSGVSGSGSRSSADQRSSAAAEAAAVPQAHSVDHDQTLEKASSAELTAAAATVHLPVKPLEEQVYRDKVGEHAFLIKVFAR